MINDLTKTQITETKKFYDNFADRYAEDIEWNEKTIKGIKKFNINPVCHFCRQGGDLLLIGCGTGRDYLFFQEKGYHCVGIDNSVGMLNEARKRVAGKFIQLDLRQLNKLNKKFDGIYCESALTHIPKRELDNIIIKFGKLLRPTGIIYLAIKIGKSGVIVKENFGAKRFFIIYEKQEFFSYLIDAGFHIIWSKTSRHTFPGFPQWLSIIVKRKSDL